MTNHITLVTSIPPKIKRTIDDQEVGVSYQNRCIESWINAGINLISVNTKRESDHIANAHPGVTVVEVEHDAKIELGRPLIYISDAIDVAASSKSDYVGIVNADILFTGSSELMKSYTKKIDESTIIVANRREFSAYNYPLGAFYQYGFDLFLFHREISRMLDLSGFAFGQPWWDYWLPMCAISNNVKVSILRNSNIRHLTHDQAWDSKLWRTGLRNMASKLKKSNLFKNGSDKSFGWHLSNFVLNAADPDLIPPFGSHTCQTEMAALLGVAVVNYLQDTSEIIE